MAREDFRGFYEYRTDWRKNNPDKTQVTLLASYMRKLARMEKERPDLYALAKARVEAEK